MLCVRQKNSSWKKNQNCEKAVPKHLTQIKKVKSGTTYYYTVKAYKGKKVSSYNKKD